MGRFPDLQLLDEQFVVAVLLILLPLADAVEHALVLETLGRAALLLAVTSRPLGRRQL